MCRLCKKNSRHSQVPKLCSIYKREFICVLQIELFSWNEFCLKRQVSIIHLDQYHRCREVSTQNQKLARLNQLLTLNDVPPIKIFGRPGKKLWHSITQKVLLTVSPYLWNFQSEWENPKKMCPESRCKCRLNFFFYRHKSFRRTCTLTVPNRAWITQSNRKIKEQFVKTFFKDNSIKRFFNFEFLFLILHLLPEYGCN